MADTSQHELSEPHTNGAIDGLTEEEKSKMRPADIDADMREMERRKRVEMMMNSRLFREELERIIETQMKDGGAGPSGLLQQISDMMGAQGARFNSNVFKSSNCVVPINDIRGVESMGYAKGEKLLRCKLAAVFRLLDLYGWTQGVGGHITARLNQDQEHFLVNPYGLLYHEVTASSLVKVDMQGSVVEQGTTNFGVHVTGFQLHSTIHAARPDIKCIVHITTPSVIAVSSLKCGLLPLGQESIVIGEASMHQYIGGVFEPEEKEKIARNLGPVNKIIFLTNRGALCCGETVEEAFFNVYNTVLACETQLKLIPAGIDNLNLISEESRKAIFDASRKPPVPQHASVAEPSPLADKLEKRWRIGGTEFEALMRMLDNAGFRTGYIYRNPLVKGEPPRPRNDVEVPPAVSSLGYLLEEEELYKQGLWKGGRKGTDRSRWLNSPNVYQKVEILETGTPDPKKITKWVDQNAEEWVTDGSPTHSSTPVKIESALQFVPKNTNPKEFKQLQQQIKDYRRADKISAGPQSHILEGVTWDEAKKMQDATISATGEQVVLVGAASKGIIQRGFQHNAMVYKTPYAKNPFDAITDQELDQYKKDVERKQKGDPYDESQSESEALSSFNVSRATHESSTAKSPIQSPVSVTSETEEGSRDEPRVLRIETKQVPVPSQPEVVLSDESTQAAVIMDTPVVQQALIQQVQEQSQNVIHHKNTADATTEFLNEMRRTAIDPRNDLNRRDCQSSRSSSVSSGHSYGWPTEPYDTVHLEVARSRTVAPRMTPLITEIVLHSKSKNTEIARTNFKTKLPPPVPPKPKPYLALRHAFLNSFNSCTADSDPHNFNVNVICTVDRTQAAEAAKLLNVPEEQTSPVNLSVNSKNVDSLGNGIHDFVIESKSSKKESLNSCIRESGMENFSFGQERGEKRNKAACITTDNLEESISVERYDNDDKTVFQNAIDSSHKPVIVGAILKNINDLHSLCLGSNERTDILENGGERDKTETDRSPCFEQNRSDENGNPCSLPKKSQEIEKISPTDLINNNNSNSLSLYSATNLNRENILEVQTICDSQSKDLANNNPEEEQVLVTEALSSSHDEFTTPPRARNYTRLDSLMEVINSIKVDMTPTKMLLGVLPESNISSKYNLDSTNMSLIYSLTPTNDDMDEERYKLTKNESDESFTDNVCIRRLDSCNTNESVHDEETEFIWVDLATAAKRDHDERSNETIDLLTSSMESLNDEDEECNQGSDILELPYSTVQELRETDGDSFNHDIKTVANQIIAELGDIEMYTHASNFIDEILYDISCLKLDQNRGKNSISEVVQDKLHALGIAKDIANSLIRDLPCYVKETMIFQTLIDDKSPVSSRGDDSDKVIVIEEIVHHIIDKFDSTPSSSISSPDSYNLKKVKESANTEIKEMQSSLQILNEENYNVDFEDKSSKNPSEKSKTIFVKENVDAADPIEVITIDDVDEQLNCAQEIQHTHSQSGEFEIDSSQNFQALENESFQSEGCSPGRYHSDERLFITLESCFSSKHSSALTSDASKSTEDSKNKENDFDYQKECYFGTNFAQSLLDCDECSFVGFKRYKSIEDKDEEEASDYTDEGSYNAKSSLENTESDITDHDTLGEAILNFCTIAKLGSTGEFMELNFSIEGREDKEKSGLLDIEIDHLEQNAQESLEEQEFDKQMFETTELAECTQCRCCTSIGFLDFIAPGQLPPISEEANESLDNFTFAKDKEEPLNESLLEVKHEEQFDYLDFLSDSEILIAAWFDEYGTSSSSGDDKALRKSADQSAVSLESVKSIDYYSCRDDSCSTAFQSLSNTTGNNPSVEKQEDSDLEVIYVADKAENKLNGTYTISDTSLNSLDTVSSIESDELKRSTKAANTTYSADISTNVDEANSEPQKSFSSSSSDARLSSEENCFDTTANMADVSGELLLRKFEQVRCSGREENAGRDEGGQSGLESSLILNSTSKNEPQDCMVYSYDTREFMRLEEAISLGTKDKIDIVHCTCLEKNCREKLCSHQIVDIIGLSPIDPPPRYEDTTLYRVVSEINLTDDDDDIRELDSNLLGSSKF